MIPSCVVEAFVIFTHLFEDIFVIRSDLFRIFVWNASKRSNTKITRSANSYKLLIKIHYNVLQICSKKLFFPKKFHNRRNSSHKGSFVQKSKLDPTYAFL